MTGHDKRDWARTLFLHEKLTQKEIAGKVGVSEVTMSKWVKAEGWERMRQSLVLTKQKLLQQQYIYLEAIQAKIEEREKPNNHPNNKEADIISKLTASIRNLETEVSLAETITTFIEFGTWLRKVAPIDKVKEFVELQDAYIRQLNNK